MTKAVVTYKSGSGHVYQIPCGPSDGVEILKLEVDDVVVWKRPPEANFKVGQTVRVKAVPPLDRTVVREALGRRAVIEGVSVYPEFISYNIRLLPSPALFQTARESELEAV